MQETLVTEATALSSTLSLPQLSSDIVNGILDSTKKVETTAAGFVPFLHNTATAPPNNGISLTLNVTEVNLKSSRLTSLRLCPPPGLGGKLQGLLLVTAPPSAAMPDSSGKQVLKVLRNAAGEERGLYWCDPQWGPQAHDL